MCLGHHPHHAPAPPQFNQTLTVLRLTDNSIPDEGLAQLVAVAAERNVVTSLDLSGNRAGPQTVAALVALLGTKVGS